MTTGPNVLSLEYYSCYAARELKTHLDLITGASFEILPESSSALARYPVKLHVGHTQAARNHFGNDAKSILPVNGFRIATSGNSIFIQGYDQRNPLDSNIPYGPQLEERIPGCSVPSATEKIGTILGVNDFLEGLGVRWIWPGQSGIVAEPRQTLSVIPYQKTGEPYLRTSRFRVENAARMMADSTYAAGWILSGESTAGGTARVNRYLCEVSRWYRRLGLVQTLLTFTSHSFTGYWATHGSSSPHFFQQLPDGTRRPFSQYQNGRGEFVSMDVVSEPPAGKRSLADQKIEDWKYFVNTCRNICNTELPNDPTRRAECLDNCEEVNINVSENDTASMDMTALASDPEDPLYSSYRLRDLSGRSPDGIARWQDRQVNATQAFNARDPFWWTYLGSRSDRYARFSNQVLQNALIAARSLNVNQDKIRVGALAYANYVNAPVNTLLGNKTWVAFTSPVMAPWSSTPTSGNRALARNALEGWARTGANLIFRPNFTLDGHNYPYLWAPSFVEDFAHALQNGVIGTDFDSLTGHFGTQGLNIYSVARLSGNPLRGNDVHEEFYNSFGNAKEEVEAYFSFMNQQFSRMTSDDFAESIRATTVDRGGYVGFFLVGADYLTPTVLSQAETLLRSAESAGAGSGLQVVKRLEQLRRGFTLMRLNVLAAQAYIRWLERGDNTAIRTAIPALNAARQTYLREMDRGEPIVTNPGRLTFFERRVWGNTPESIPSVSSAIVNGFFDQSLTSWLTITRWGSARYDVTTDSQSDGRFARITCQGLDGSRGCFGAIYQNFSLTANREYRIIVKVRTPAGSQNRGSVWVLDGGNRVRQVNFAPTDGHWKRIMIRNLNFSQASGRIFVNLEASQLGAMDVDSIAILPD